MLKKKERCLWAESDPLYQKYHDEEWGFPLVDEEKLFELFVLETMQAGLSWITILKKRENYRNAFDQFNPEKIARYTEKRAEKLLQNPGIIRNRLKIKAIIENAKAYLALKKAGINFSDYIWSFVDGKPIQNSWKTHSEIPAKTPISDALAQDLKKRGFKFVGSTTCYAFMQAAGLVNDHLQTCFCKKLAKKGKET